MTAIAFIGFGEAAEAFAKGWNRPGLRAFDEKVEDAQAAALPQRRANATGVALAPDRATALEGAGAVFCLVTADRAVLAAEQAAPHLPPGAFWLDGNSCSPGAKRRAAAIVEAPGGRYVDLAIMAPVYPRLHRTPLLVAGPHAGEALAVLSALGWRRRSQATAWARHPPSR